MFNYCYLNFLPSSLYLKQIEKLQVLLHENKQRLEQAQQDTAKAKEECLKLTELLGKAEQQLHFLRYHLSCLFLTPVSISHFHVLSFAYPQLLQIKCLALRQFRSECIMNKK